MEAIAQAFQLRSAPAECHDRGHRHRTAYGAHDADCHAIDDSALKPGYGPAADARAVSHVLLGQIPGQTEALNHSPELHIVCHGRRMGPGDWRPITRLL